ncbi:MAG: teichoic acid biosynthesis protein [Candidatus Poribacteria bacterium]|nr:teichoic acid biosynthesis protein [Candidatus Poribacteria bacterium]
MATIFYSLSGEGRGHATRVRAVVEQLRQQHRVVIYAPGHAYELLLPVYEGTEVNVRHIPGLAFHYKHCRLTGSRKLDTFKTGMECLHYIAQYTELSRRLQDDIETESPDLVITDFEPALPRVARQVGIPFISLDHQHFLLVSDLRKLPVDLQRHAFFMAQVVRGYYHGQVQTVVSSFYFPPLKPNTQGVSQIGVLLRDEILQATPEHGEHIVVYLRRFGSSEVFRALEACGCEVRIYGLGAQRSIGRLKFREIDMHRFVDDLATSRALISTAGNQLIGEALYLEKPVLAMPEYCNHEQRINGHFLQDSGAGMTVGMEQMTPLYTRYFMKHCEMFRSRIDRQNIHGNTTALNIINQYLPRTA